jgi:hypothetical protein
VKRSRLMACSGAEGGDVLWLKRLRSKAKRSSGVEGALRRRWHALGEAIEVEGEAIERR